MTTKADLIIIFVSLSYVFSFSYASKTLPDTTFFTLTECGIPDYSSYQQFTQFSLPKNHTNNTHPHKNYTMFKLTSYPGSCIDCNSGISGASPWIWQCDINISNQYFHVREKAEDTHVLLENGVKDTCLTANYFNSLNNSLNISTIYSAITMETCDERNPDQQFILNNNNIISKHNESLCLTATPSNSVLSSNINCTIYPLSTYAYCNQKLPVIQRVTDLISRMSLTEKIQNLAHLNTFAANPLLGGVIRLGVSPNLYMSLLHGVLIRTCINTTNINSTGCATSFPHALLLGATYNRSLWKEIATTISTEARSFANLGMAGLFYWDPNINIFRDPRWGRGQETPGEDPYLTGQYAQTYVYHLQGGDNNINNKYYKLIATAKHYSDYDVEGDRGSFNANVTIQEQIEFYWPAWRTVVQNTNIGSIMCSFTAVNNTPSCGNRLYENEILRNEWEFDGFIVSDCNAIDDGSFVRYINDTYPQLNDTMKQYEQTRIAMQSGTDANCGNWYQYHLQNTVQNGFLSENNDINIALQRVFIKMFELGKLDYAPPSNYTNINIYGANNIDTNAHRFIAQNAAEQGIVLLKNNNSDPFNHEGILPLNIGPSSTLKIAMIGPHANATQDMLSNYHGINTLVNSNSPFQSMKRILKQQPYMLTDDNILYVEGCDNIECFNRTDGFDEAIYVADYADIVIVFLGLHPEYPNDPSQCREACEAEAYDRNTIEFPGKQLELLKELFIVNQNIILVLINGGQIDLSWPKEFIPAIVEAFYPGELGGTAIANILLGKISPAGKLPYTIYDKTLLKRRSISDMHLRDKGGITYRYYTGRPVYKFGFGLSYTTFKYTYFNKSDDIIIKTKQLADFYRHGYYNYKSQDTQIIVGVTNTGRMDSDCVVLGFIKSEDDPDAPLLKLFDFQRVFIAVNQSVNVTLYITAESISITNKYGNERIVPGKYHLYLGDYQSNNYIHSHLVLTGKEESIFNLKQIKEKYKYN